MQIMGKCLTSEAGGTEVGAVEGRRRRESKRKRQRESSEAAWSGGMGRRVLGVGKMKIKLRSHHAQTCAPVNRPPTDCHRSPREARHQQRRTT